jgi:hypothetical protein
MPIQEAIGSFFFIILIGYVVRHFQFLKIYQLGTIWNGINDRTRKSSFKLINIYIYFFFNHEILKWDCCVVLYVKICIQYRYNIFFFTGVCMGVACYSNYMILRFYFIYFHCYFRMLRPIRVQRLCIIFNNSRKK